MKSAIIAVIRVHGLKGTATTPETEHNVVYRDADLEPDHITLHEFENHIGYACRGLNGKHDNSDHYFEKIQASPDECEVACSGHEWCTGYEISDDHRCELWVNPIGVHLESREAASCYVKEIIETDHSYEVIRGHACRGVQGTHDTKAHYFEYKRLSATECRSECNQHEWCTGYETGNNNQCELWKESIGDHLQQERGLSCYIKDTEEEVDHCQAGRVKSISGSQEFHITFENHSEKPVQTNWINYDHVSVEFQTLNSFEKVTQQSYESQPWLLTDDEGQVLVEDFIVGENLCAENRRSRSSDHQSEFQIHNSGSDSMELYWLNYEGESIHIHSLEPEADVRLQTAATHPWYITIGGETAVQWTVGNSEFELTTDGREEFKLIIQ